MNKHDCETDGHCWHVTRSWETNKYFYCEYICCFCGGKSTEKMLIPDNTIYTTEDIHGPYIRTNVSY